jgi:uncharacterized protein
MSLALDTRARAVALALLLPLAGCAGSPDPTFYALSSHPGRRLTSPAWRIELRRVAMPSYLDRPHVVRRASPERLELAADERWGAPLDALVGATLAEDLGERLPSCVVFSEASSISAPADVRIEVEITRFESAADGVVQLRAGSAVRWGTESDRVRLNRHTIDIRPSTKSTADLVSSLSRSLSQLADAVAQTVLEGPPSAIAGPDAVGHAGPVVPVVPIEPDR